MLTQITVFALCIAAAAADTLEVAQDAVAKARRTEFTDGGDPDRLTDLETGLAVAFAITGAALLAFVLWYFFCRVPEPRQVITKYENRVQQVHTPVPVPMVQAPVMSAPVVHHAPMQMQAPMQMMGTVQGPIMGGMPLH